MKYVLLIFGVLLASASAGTRFDDELREFIEYVKQQMPCGFPAIDMPPLAPYKKDFRKFDFTPSGLEFSGNLTNLEVNGLNDIEIKELSYEPLMWIMKFDFIFKQIKVLSQYMASGSLKFLGLPITLSGNGDLDLVAENIRFNGSFMVYPKGLELRILAFDTNLRMEKVQSKTTGIMNSEILSRIFNQWVEEFFAILFEDYQREINAEIRRILVPMGDNMLHGVTLVDLWILIFGFGPNSENLPVCVVE